MSDIIEIDAQARNVTGKGAARKIRNENRIPAVIYGQKKEPVIITVCFNTIMKFLERGGFKQAQINLNVDGTNHKVMVKDIQINPVRHLPRHIDFIRIA